MSVLELLVGLQQVTQSVVELFLLHQRATFLMEAHGQDQSLTTHTIKPQKKKRTQRSSQGQMMKINISVNSGEEGFSLLIIAPQTPDVFITSLDFWFYLLLLVRDRQRVSSLVGDLQEGSGVWILTAV